MMLVALLLLPRPFTADVARFPRPLPPLCSAAPGAVALPALMLVVAVLEVVIPPTSPTTRPRLTADDGGGG